MKDKKKILDNLKQANEAVQQANKALSEAMQELDESDLDAIAGGNNPFADVDRVPTQPLDPNIREKA